MRVCVCAPVALRERAKPFHDRWAAMGYEVLIQQDPVEENERPYLESWSLVTPWHGVWRSWNDLAKMAVGAGVDVCVLVGDDMDPDPHVRADLIAEQYAKRFPDLAGVMQPCGDPQGDLIEGKRNAERICGSPWVGAGWVNRAYMGDGPVCGLYQAFYADEELVHVAGRLDRLWWRKDLSQFHKHWSFGHTKRQPYHEKAQRHWQADKMLYESRLRAAFPGAELMLEG